MGWCVCMLSRSVVSDSLQPHGLQLARLLCPWDYPGKSTGVGRNFLLQVIFPHRERTQGSPALQADSLPLSHQESPELALALLNEDTPGNLHFLFLSCSCTLTLPLENTAIHRSGRKLSQKLTMLHLDLGCPVSITERKSVSVI